MKLLNLVAADRAYFGEKDYQQFRLVEDMVKSFFIKSKIIGCPIVREEDGLAISSRNRRLSSDDRKQAKQFPQLINSTDSDETTINKLEIAGFSVDYVKTLSGRRFAAVKLGPKDNPVRLIDNVHL